MEEGHTDKLYHTLKTADQQNLQVRLFQYVHCTFTIHVACFQQLISCQV